MTVYLDDPDVTLYLGDALETLRGMPDESVHCVCTSPPYWGLRDYGTGAWEGGDPDCDHLPPPIEPKVYDNGQGQGYTTNNQNWNKKGRQYQGDVCGKCGAHRTDNQMGLEPTPELYVQNMVTVFREVRRVLRRDGTCWLNIGDAYGSGVRTQMRSPSNEGKHGYWSNPAINQRIPGTPAKQLLGMPWRLAFALQQDGWWLRADIIWAKPNPMPESVTDRPTKAHEYVFLLTRSPRYFFDQEAVREPHESTRWGGRYSGPGTDAWKNGTRIRERDDRDHYPEGGRNVRSVWEIATEPFPAAHFATFPTELARRCILAGTSERGCCPECGAPWERQIEMAYKPSVRHAVGAGKSDRTDGYFGKPKLDDTGEGQGPNRHRDGHTPGLVKAPITLGWRPSCKHREWESEITGSYRSLAPVPCTVLDPFAGACTVPHVARRHGRHSIGIELSETYLRQIALPRLQQLSLLA